MTVSLSGAIQAGFLHPTAVHQLTVSGEVRLAVDPPRALGGKLGPLFRLALRNISGFLILQRCSNHRPERNSSTALVKTAGCSSCGRWPAFSITSNLAPGTSEA